MRPRLAAVAGLLALGLIVGCGEDGDHDNEQQREARAGEWKTWVLESSSEVRVAPPPKDGSAAAERDEAALERAMADRTPAQEALARTVSRSPVVEPWMEQSIELVSSLPKDVPASSRAYSHTAVAMYDAAVAAAHWKAAYDRDAPDADSSVERTPGPSYPSEHAAIAGAASRTLAALYPDYPSARLDQQAERAAQSLVAAGTIRPSDAEAGLELGRAVAEKVIAHARDDGFNEIEWDGRRPRGPEHWEPPPGSAGKPNRPWAGKAKTWIARPISDFRPPAPPRYGSKEFIANARDVMRVKENLTPRQKRIAQFWEGMEGTALPAGIWNQVTVEYLRDKDLSVPREARTFALLNVALADSGSAAWDAKYLTGWWDPRPINSIRDLGLDKKWESYLLPTPLFPAYPSGTSNYSGAASEVLAHLFPDDAEMWRRRGKEAGYSRLYGGVHWRIDVVEGLKMGRKVAGVVVDRAKSDGAE